MTVQFKQAKKRTAGQRAGMTRAKIAAAGLKLWREGGSNAFTVRSLAKALKVAPTTIYAHYKEGERELRKEVARLALEALTPHYQPKQDAKDYLRTFLREALETFRKAPGLGHLVVSELTDDLELSLVFLERMGVTIKAIGGQDLIGGVEVLVERLSGLALIEMGNWARRKPDTQRTRLQIIVYNAPASEYPTLKAASKSLGAGLTKRAAETYLWKQADRLAEVLISEWKKAPA